jgi:hypothetical protein
MLLHIAYALAFFSKRMLWRLKVTAAIFMKKIGFLSHCTRASLQDDMLR